MWTPFGVVDVDANQVASLDSNSSTPQKNCQEKTSSTLNPQEEYNPFASPAPENAALSSVSATTCKPAVENASRVFATPHQSEGVLAVQALSDDFASLLDEDAARAAQLHAYASMPAMPTLASAVSPPIHQASPLPVHPVVAFPVSNPEEGQPIHVSAAHARGVVSAVPAALLGTGETQPISFEDGFFEQASLSMPLSQVTPKEDGKGGELGVQSEKFKTGNENQFVAAFEDEIVEDDAFANGMDRMLPKEKNDVSATVSSSVHPKDRSMKKSNALPSISDEIPAFIAPLPRIKVCRALPKHWTREARHHAKKKARKRRHTLGVVDREMKTTETASREEGALRKNKNSGSYQGEKMPKIKRSRSLGKALRLRKNKGSKKSHPKHQPQLKEGSSSETALAAAMKKKEESQLKDIPTSISVKNVKDIAGLPSSSAKSSGIPVPKDRELQEGIPVGKEEVPSLIHLPENVLSLVCDYLSVRSLCRLARTSRYCRKVVNSCQAWKRIYENHYGVQPWYHFGKDDKVWELSLLPNDYRTLVRSRIEEYTAMKNFRWDPTLEAPTVYVDIIEKVLVKFSAEGKVIEGMVKGQVVCRALSPVRIMCILLFNHQGPPGEKPPQDPVRLDEFVVHHCVDSDVLRKTKNRLVFCPPGAANFQLVRYRSQFSQSRRILVRFLPVYQYHASSQCLRIKIVLSGLYDNSLSASRIRVMIPIPPGSLSVKKLSHKDAQMQWKGHTKILKPHNIKCPYDYPVLLWKVAKLRGQREIGGIFEIKINSELYHAWKRGPALLEMDPLYGGQFTRFRIRMLRVHCFHRDRFLPYHDKSAIKLVRNMAVIDSYRVTTQKT